MKSNYKKLGQFIRQVDVRNTNLSADRLLGVSVQKKFIPSIANTIGTDFSKYKIVERGQFTYIPDTSRRGDKIGIALLDNYDEGLVSNIYTVFEIIDKTKLIPEYLMLWFNRPEFDRYARYKSHGSVREIFDWNEMCNVELPVPSIEKQLEIVYQYKVISGRIALKQKINDKFEEYAQIFFKRMFANYYESLVLPKGWYIERLENLCDIKGGKRLPIGYELLDFPTNHPYIRVRDINKNYVFLTNKFQYIDEETYSSISKYIVNENDIIISIVGTIGLIGKIHKSLDGANLTENCVKLANINIQLSDYIYYTLCYKRDSNELNLLTVGGVQAKLPIYNIKKIDVIVPSIKLLSEFQSQVNTINKQIELNLIEIQELINLLNMLISRL